MIIYSLRPVSIRSDSAQQKTNPKSGMTRCPLSIYLYSVEMQGATYCVCHWTVYLVTFLFTCDVCRPYWWHQRQNLGT